MQSNLFLTIKILHSNRYYNHHDLHLSIENINQIVSYELTLKISNCIEFVIVVQQIVIIRCFENIIENIIEILFLHLKQKF